MITDISDDKVDMVSANEIYHKALLEDEGVFNDVVASSTTYRKTNKEMASEKLSKIGNTCKDSIGRAICTTTRYCIRQKNSSSFQR